MAYAHMPLPSWEVRMIDTDADTHKDADPVTDTHADADADADT